MISQQTSVTDTRHKAVYIRKSTSKKDGNTLYLTIHLSGIYYDGERKDRWKSVMKLSSSSIEESKERIRRLKIIRSSEIRRKKIEYLRFTRKLESSEYNYYINGIKIDPFDLPAIADKIYKRREERHKHGKSSQLDENVIFTFLGNRIIDIEFPTNLESPNTVTFSFKDVIQQFIPTYRSKGYDIKR